MTICDDLLRNEFVDKHLICIRLMIRWTKRVNEISAEFHSHSFFSSSSSSRSLNGDHLRLKTKIYLHNNILKVGLIHAFDTYCYYKCLWPSTLSSSVAQSYIYLLAWNITAIDVSLLNYPQSHTTSLRCCYFITASLHISLRWTCHLGIDNKCRRIKINPRLSDHISRWNTVAGDCTKGSARDI